MLKPVMVFIEQVEKFEPFLDGMGNLNQNSQIFPAE